MDRREHHRAHLRLPVRLRWNTPLWQKTEVTKTLDISRRGLLVPCAEEHEPGMSVWVTFPYDASIGDGQPEIAARVVRVATPRNGTKAGLKLERATSVHKGQNEAPALALEFLAFVSSRGGNGHRGEPERRQNLRQALAIPLRVRLDGVPWFEEAMTFDISRSGLRFLSTREYQTGAIVLVSFGATASAPWPVGVEIRSRVTRSEPVPNSAAMAIAVCRADLPKD